MTKTKLLPLAQAAEEWALITGTPQPHSSTVLRWIVKGVRGVRLQGEQVACRWYVAPESLEHFRHATSQFGDRCPMQQGAKGSR